MIEEKQLEVDRSATRPQVEFFSGYQVYSERDPNVGPAFNHGYVVGLNASWPLFDGFATRGRMQATRARRDGALLALKAVRLGIESEVRSAFLDLEQADSVLQAQTKNVQTADESLAFAKSNFAAGLGTQLDILQAAADVTRTRTTRLSAIYLHNAALARLDRAAGGESEMLDREERSSRTVEPNDAQSGEQIFRSAQSPRNSREEKMKRRLLLLLAVVVVGSPALRGLTLDEALARALEKNPRIQQAKTAVEQAAGQRLVFRSIALPVASIRAPVGVQGGKRAGQPPNEPFAFAQGSFRQPLFYAAIPASLRRGEIEVLVAAQELNVTVVEQLHQVRTAFYTALYDRSLEELGRSQRQRLDENLTSEEARYAAGTVDRGALAAATLQARELDPQIEDAHRAYGAAILQLATAMGDDLAPGAALPSPQGTLDFKPVNFPLESETSAALERRADLRLARLLVRGSPRRPAHRRRRFLSAPRSHAFRPIHPENRPSPARLEFRAEHH